MAARLNVEINKALALPWLTGQITVEGAVQTPTAPTSFTGVNRRKIPRVADVVRAGNVNPECARAIGQTPLDRLSPASP